MIDWFNIFELVVGIAYMFFGKGPTIPNVPALILALLRLVAPFLMIGIVLLQAVAAKEQRP